MVLELPLGVAVNTSQTRFTADGGCSDDGVSASLATLARQVTLFATRNPELLCA